LNSTINDNKNIGSIKNYIKDATIDIIIPSEDNYLTYLGESIKKILYNEKIKVSMDYKPFNKYLEKLFITKDFDIAIVSYKFEPGLLKYFQFFNNKQFSFSDYINVNEMTYNKVSSMLNEAVDSSNFEKQRKITDNIFEIFFKNNQFSPMYSKRQYYLIQNNIRNFKINSSYDDMNLLTIEFMEKSMLSK
jgi:hypothetical protein